MAGGVVSREGLCGARDDVATIASEGCIIVLPPFSVKTRSLFCCMSSRGRLRSCSASSESPCEALRSLPKYSGGAWAILVPTDFRTSHDGRSIVILEHATVNNRFRVTTPDWFSVIACSQQCLGGGDRLCAWVYETFTLVTTRQ